jgi:D-lactate dehydrogenase (cytochrome)
MCTEPTERDRLWKARRDSYFAFFQAYKKMPGVESEVKMLVTDVCVPIPELPRIIAETEKDFHAHGALCPIVGHVGDGNFHVCSPFNNLDKEEAAKMDMLNDRIVGRALACGGTCSGEHGVGIGKVPHAVEELGEDAIELMRKIKRAIDPSLIMNPGKVFSSVEHKRRDRALAAASMKDSEPRTGFYLRTKGARL